MDNGSENSGLRAQFLNRLVVFSDQIGTSSEIRKTKVYQEALQEGKQEGKQEGLDHERSLILRQLERRIGKVSKTARSASATKVVRRFYRYRLLSLIFWVRRY